MVQQAVGGDAEAPLISPTESEDAMWDALEYEDAPADESTGEEPEPGADETELDDGGESEDESPEEQPVEEGRAAAAQQREDWVRAAALDPSAIQQVPRRQRKWVSAAAEVVRPAALRVGQQMAGPMAQAELWRMIQLQDKVSELDVLAEDDPQQFQAALANPDAHGFSNEAIDQWRQIRQWRETGGPAGMPPQGGQRQPQQQGQPQVDAGVSRWQTRATALLDEYAEEFGEEAVGDVVAWLREEGLVNVRTAQEAESGYKALRAHLDGQRKQSRGGPPPAVKRRRTLPKPDVSPGSVAVGGRASRDEIHRRAFQGSESDAWAAV